MADCEIDAMVAALEVEIKAIKRKGSGASIEVRGGERRGTAAGYVLYAFPAPTEEIRVPDDTPVRIVAGREEVSGTIVSVTDKVLVIAIERDLGNRIPHARLMLDDTFLLEQLKKKLEEVRGGQSPFNLPKARQVMGLESFETKSGVPCPDLFVGAPPT